MEVFSPQMWETIHPLTHFEQNPEQPHLIQCFEHGIGLDDLKRFFSSKNIQ